MKKLLSVIFIALLFFSCHSQDCNNLPVNFKSYNEAISKIEKSKFKFEDEANTSRSSWITSAKYYSCDGIAGYFIYSTNRNHVYIHKDVPIEIWRQFKTASSLGSFYDNNIKYKYQIIVK